jgi:hypothetical protein
VPGLGRLSALGEAVVDERRRLPFRQWPEGVGLATESWTQSLEGWTTAFEFAKRRAATCGKRSKQRNRHRLRFVGDDPSPRSPLLREGTVDVDDAIYVYTIECARG